ncbi:efflux RND transporter permease subunit [Endozoicomonas arenosclerae]|uniref:efflux RND transporter permease subunit n=1 Tax=Endozoicomonas arenosclerae TaxID=1633495 RepID=UPI0007853705|nr:efflux RND transporter permease subunit [Endozoicomonas arenosclerae]
MDQTTENQKGFIAWFANNSVAANLLMIMIVVAGLMTAFTIKKRMFPDFAVNTVQVEVIYPGAGPEDVEQGVLVKLEESLRDISGIKKVVSITWEGYGRLRVELESGYEIDQLYDDVKTAVEGVTNLPTEAEEPTVTKLEQNEQVLYISLYGDMDRISLQRMAQTLQDELLTLPDVLSTNLLGESDLEISILVSENKLRQYGLTFDEVARALRASSIDVAGGSIKTDDGDIAVKTRGQAYKGFDFYDFEIRTNPDGSRLLLSDIATIHDGFEETQGLVRFNGKTAVAIEIVSETEQNDIRTSKAVRAYLDERKASLPQGMEVKIWGDISHYLQGRMDMMMENMFYGAILVFLLLSLFLRIRVAVWVIVGIPVCFLGAIWLMPNGFMPVSINMLSLFAFILVLGIVVDDAIIIGESVYTQISRHGHTPENVVAGVKRVVVPATFGVLTTMAVFIPLLMIEGSGEPFFTAISLVVIFCLVFSLVESKMILPAHLAHMKKLEQGTAKKGFFTRVQDRFAQWLERFVERRYLPLISSAVRNRYVTISVFMGLMVVLVGVIQSPLIRFSFFPEVPSEFIRVELEMNAGSSIAERDSALTRIEQSMFKVDKTYRDSHPDESGLFDGMMLWSQGDTTGIVFVELTKNETRTIGPKETADLWREETGEILGVKQLTFSSGQNAGGSKPVYFRLTGSDSEQLDQAAAALEKHLNSYEGLFDVENSADASADEVVIDILPSAQALGLSLADLGNQVRQGFYGEEVQKIQRGREEVKVILRYPPDERNDLTDLEKVRIRTADGNEVPFYQVASVEQGEGASFIRRTDGKRSLAVSADLDKETLDTQTVVDDVIENFAPELKARYPEVDIVLGGATKEEMDSLQQLLVLTTMAMLLVYALIAIPLKSYLQPMIIMGIIPFGLVGAVIGHLILDLQLSMMSIFGLIALAGVLVNDSLILVDFINKGRDQGMSLYHAAIHAGKERFRAIILTSLTTFLGLVPITLEQSLQAQFVIPMAVSLGFGILFATAITLILTPALYLVIEDIKSFLRWVWTGQRRPDMEIGKFSEPTYEPRREVETTT